jgi:hypothetical protein
MFVDKARSLYWSEAPERYAQPLFTNIKLGWKVFPGINTLAYYEHF